MEELRRDVRALHPESQDMDWLFCSNNPLAPKIAAMNLSRDFEVPKDMFEGKRDPRAHLMQYNDYMNVPRVSNLAKCKTFSMTLKESANDCDSEHEEFGGLVFIDAFIMGVQNDHVQYSFTDNRPQSLGQSSRGDPKGKQKVRGTIHVTIGMDEKLATSSTKRNARLRGVMSIGSPKIPR
ncbi:hypothetical protein J1N35_015094 [Gossypium stocksii]|uniref:Uncharacterized protein n=1 Tax=Gossypium stocksii TaxID=47602 RepID=A0A9D3VWK4_9ROSI|nr:hypothetical protein J1N35_015094 [Gossypium stocksii]